MKWFGPLEPEWVRLYYGEITWNEFYEWGSYGTNELYRIDQWFVEHRNGWPDSLATGTDDWSDLYYDD